MLISAIIARGHHGRPNGLYGLLSQVVIRHESRFTDTHRRWAHANPPQQAAPHEAKVDNIRNIGIIAHVDAGKTTTTERMLYYSGLTRHLGNVDHGDTVTDFLPMERERGITIQSAAISFNWPRAQDCLPGQESKTINLIDTPGHQDFQYEVLRCMPVLDGAVCVMDSVKGVEAHTERVWGAAQQFKIPRIIFVNKLDRDGASFRKSVLEIASRLKSWPLVCQIPWWSGDDFVGVIDIIKRVGYKWSSGGTRKDFPTDALQSVLASNPLRAEIEEAREQLIERLCEVDDELALEFAERGEELSPEAIKVSIRRAISDGNGSVVPVLAGASLRNVGVEPLLDAVVDYLPSPEERPDVQVKSGREMYNLKELIQQEVSKLQKKKGKLADETKVTVASVFKVTSDPHRGMLSFVRVYYGTLQRTSTMWNSNEHVFERALSMMQIAANKTNDIPHLTVGGIGAMAGLKKARTGDTLIISPENLKEVTILRSMQIRPAIIPPAVTFISIEPFSSTNETELEKALENASREDPSLRWNKDEKAGHYVLSGMGRLHLEVAMDNLKKYKIDAMFGTIQVDYKESLTGPMNPEHCMIDRLVAGKPGKTSCLATLEPLEAGHHDVLESWGDKAARLGYTDLESPDDFNHISMERAGNLININIIRPLDDPKHFNLEHIVQNLQNGVVSALYRGPRRGYALHGCHVEIVFDCQKDFFGPASSGHYLQAAYHAVRNALKNAHEHNMIALLEPVMKVDIVCPEVVVSQVRHDLSSRHGGHVLETEDLNDGAASEGEIDLSQVYAPPDPYESISTLRASKKSTTRMLRLGARVPLKEMLHYDQHLRSMTEGRHSIEMELDTFERVTGHREKLL